MMTDTNSKTDKTTRNLTPATDARSDGATDAEQRELWARYLEQQTRRSCPGCGESGNAVL